MIKHAVIGALCGGFCIVNVFSQGEIDEEKKIFYRNESSVALLLNSNGYGGNYRFARRINAYNARLLDLDFVYVKHPKEYKSASLDPYNYRSFVFGKWYSFYTLRTDIGFQKEIFSKSDKGSLSIRYFYNAGLSLGLMKPIYYKVATGPAVGSYPEIVVERFDPYSHTTVYGKAPFYKGISETEMVPGVNVKGGVCFEFGQRDKIVRALEGGFTLDVFPKVIEIMATEENNWFFLAVFASYRFGKAKDAKVRTRKTKLDQLLLEQNKNM